MSEEQEQRIKSAVASPDCRVIITHEEYRANEKEQEQVQAAASVLQTQKEEEKVEAEPVEQESK